MFKKNSFWLRSMDLMKRLAWGASMLASLRGPGHSLENYGQRLCLLFRSRIFWSSS